MNRGFFSADTLVSLREPFATLYLGHLMTFDSGPLSNIEKLQLLRRFVAELATITGIEATFTHGARSDTMEAALDELPGGAFGMLQYGGDDGVEISLVAVSTEDTPTASLIVSSPPIAATKPVGIERLYHRQSRSHSLASWPANQSFNAA